MLRTPVRHWRKFILKPWGMEQASGAAGTAGREALPWRRGAPGPTLGPQEGSRATPWWESKERKPLEKFRVFPKLWALEWRIQLLFFWRTLDMHAKHTTQMIIRPFSHVRRVERQLPGGGAREKLPEALWHFKCRIYRFTKYWALIWNLKFKYFQGTLGAY